MLLEVERSVNVVLHCEALKIFESREIRRAEKFHRQSAHASKEKMISLIRGCKAFNDKEFLDLIQDVCDSYSVCLRFKRPPLWLIEGLTFRNRFNDTVYLDLKEHGHDQFWILHLIDTSTRYSAARLIKTKRSEEIICNIFLMWISYFGPPKCVLSDNLTMKDTDRWMKNWILKHTLQLWKVHSAMVLWNTTIW